MIRNTVSLTIVCVILGMCACTCLENAKAISPKEIVFTGSGINDDNIFKLEVYCELDDKRFQVLSASVEIVSYYYSSLVVPNFDVIEFSVSDPWGDSAAYARFENQDWDGDSRIYFRVETSILKHPPDVEPGTPPEYQIDQVTVQLVADNWNVF